MRNLRKAIAMLLCGTTAISCAVAAGCSAGGGGNKEGTFTVYALHKGYGIDWCETLLEEFQKQSWVKEKYPDLKVAPLESNDLDAYPNNQMALGGANKFDLLFSSTAQGYNGDSSVLDITDSVYKSTVPGEGEKTVIEKMMPGFADANSFINTDGETRYSSFSYVNGMYGILYNETVMNDLGYTEDKVPVTTDEMIALMQEVKEKDGTHPKYPYKYSIINRNNGYSYQMFSTWWAQYEGLEEYTNFYYGISGDSYSVDVIKQKGRLEALKVMESFFDFNNGYLIDTNASINYLDAQLGLMQGRGLFHFNGDYFTTEMEVYKSQTRGDTIKFMKNPVISSIVENLSFYNEKDGNGKKISYTDLSAEKRKQYDEKLALMIRDIDKNITECKHTDKGITQADYERVKQARSMVNSATTQAGIIPVSSKNQEVAIDFLRFMSTDVAYKAVLKATGGLSLPFDVDAKTVAADIYDTLDAAQKVKLDIYNNKTIPAVIVQEASSFKLGRAGLGPLKSLEYNGKVNFEAVFGTVDNPTTAQKVFDADVAYWSDARWNNTFYAD